MLLLCLTASSQSSKTLPSTSPSTDAFLLANQKALGNNLVALAYKNGKIVYRKELEKEIGDFNGRTQAPAGIASQWLTAAAVMAYVDAGKISLDDKVSKYIPIFAKYMKSYITLRNCLTFTTGIQADPPGALKLLQKSKYPDLETEVDAFASKREIQTNPGTEIYFSQIGPDIAARVLEVVTKKSFDRIVQEKILRPCKMRGTSFTNENGGAINASDGAVTTPNDFISFLGMLLNKGSFEGKQVLSEKAIQEMETLQFPSLPVKFVPKEATGYKTGLGCWVSADGREITSLNGSGLWPFIDRCRNYAGIIVPKGAVSEPKPGLYAQFKENLDASFGEPCK
ncbi:MAG: serine hydrolase domain-containing protein [Bacteroidota bacterium]|nr:serine hydrolase domain-containing protein [Bacteroidota bacterium]MDP4214208.1 serine hydrolase domain-containing protein [Bacteroidota bacterium]MDP4249546.1 serine hydrolase domain-containing protein [Bacteroidota bacterium]